MRKAHVLLKSACEQAVQADLMKLSTGMREGELCGLRWADVDLKNRTLWVRRSVARDNGKYYVKPPKTRTSVRDIPLTLALTEGIDVKTVSSIMGHAYAAMTLNIYASAAANAKQASAATIDEVMERRLSPQEMGSFA